jgi:competence protein ComGC
MNNQADIAPTDAPRKGLAIASLVLGIISIPTLGLLFIGGIAGIVLGIVALNKAKQNPAQYAGRGLAIAGIVTSTLSLLVAIPGIIAAIIAIPNLIKSQQAAHETTALTEVMTIGKAQVLYSVTKGHGAFTNLSTLGAEGFIDPILATGQKGGYLFRSEPVLLVGREPMFDTTAKPLETHNFGTGNRSFGSNETFIVCEAEGAVDLKGTATIRIPGGGTRVE